MPMAQGVLFYILGSDRVDQCAEWVEAVAHNSRILSSRSLNFLLNGKGLTHSAGRIPSDVLELYDESERRYFYCDMAGFVQVKFSPALAKKA